MVELIEAAKYIKLMLAIDKANKRIDATTIALEELNKKLDAIGAVDIGSVLDTKYTDTTTIKLQGQVRRLYRQYNKIKDKRCI